MDEWKQESIRLEGLFNQATEEACIDYLIHKINAHNKLKSYQTVNAQLDAMYDEELKKYEHENPKEGFIDKIKRMVG